jgi:ribosomal protein S18 acetylase RimI-like enzyme
MDVTNYQGALSRAHWNLLLDADSWLEAARAYTPPDNPQAEIFLIGQPQKPYALCVIVPIKDGVEIKNIATLPQMRRQGMASALINHVIELARQRGHAAVEIGTGETGHAQLRLYESLGFKRDGIIPGFFTNYPEPVIENGQLCRDMVMLRLQLLPTS